MGGGASKKYAMEPGAEKTRSAGWLLSSHDHIEGPMRFESFELKVVIGKGKFGLVYTAQHAASQKYVAIKFISKGIIFETKGVQRIQQEMDILQDIHHPFIVHCCGVFEMETSFGLVFDYAAGGELFTRIRKAEKFKEPVAKFYFCEIASALGYLHDKHIIYRDLKPENILIDNDGHIKLCDFGFAVKLNGPNGTLSDGCGSAMYVAPEIAGGMMKLSHGLPVDWWSLGCILYEMITGDAPFGDIDSLSKFEIFNNINSKQVSLPMSSSASLKELVKGLLSKDSNARFAKEEVIHAAWVGDIDWKMVSSKKYVSPWIPPGRVKYNTANYLDWPKESLSYLKVPNSEESGYCSNICVPQGIRGGGGGHRKTHVGSKHAQHTLIPGLEDHAMENAGKAGASRKSLNANQMRKGSSKLRLDATGDPHTTPQGNHIEALKHRKSSVKAIKQDSDGHGHHKHDKDTHIHHKDTHHHHGHHKHEKGSKHSKDSHHHHHGHHKH